MLRMNGAQRAASSIAGLGGVVCPWSPLRFMWGLRLKLLLLQTCFFANFLKKTELNVDSKAAVGKVCVCVCHSGPVQFGRTEPWNPFTPQMWFVWIHLDVVLDPQSEIKLHQLVQGGDIHTSFPANMAEQVS